MDHQQHGDNAPASLMLSIFCGIISWISIKEAQVAVGFIASFVAIVSGLFAIRYYWLAGNEKKQNIKNNK